MNHHTLLCAALKEYPCTRVKVVGPRSASVVHLCDSHSLKPDALEVFEPDSELSITYASGGQRWSAHWELRLKETGRCSWVKTKVIKARRGI